MNTRSKSHVSSKSVALDYSQKISVVIPVLNDNHLLAVLLKQLQYLRLQGHEIIVVDGGSNNECLSSVVGSDYLSLIDFLLESSPGRARQMNLGAAKASGRLLWFLHADSNFSSDLLQELSLFAIDSSLTGQHWGWFDVQLTGKARTFRVIERMMNWRARLTRIATGDQGLFVDKSLFDAAGKFPEIALMEDIALTKKLKKLQSPVRLKSLLLTSSRRWEKQGIWRTVLLMWGLRLAYALGTSPEILARRYRHSR